MRVASTSTPEGTYATVNGKRVRPGEFYAHGHGRFEAAPGSARVSYSSSSGGHASGWSSASGGGWSSSSSSDKGKHCKSVTVQTTQRDGQEPVVTKTEVRLRLFTQQCDCWFSCYPVVRSCQALKMGVLPCPVALFCTHAPSEREIVVV